MSKRGAEDAAIQYPSSSSTRMKNTSDQTILFQEIGRSYSSALDFFFPTVLSDPALLENSLSFSHMKGGEEEGAPVR